MEQVLHVSMGNQAAGRSWMLRLAAWLRKVANPVQGENPLRIEARLNLGPKKAVVLVNCCGRRVLLALSGDAIAPLLEVPKPTRRKGVEP